MPELRISGKLLLPGAWQSRCFRAPTQQGRAHINRLAQRSGLKDVVRGAGDEARSSGASSARLEMRASVWAMQRRERDARFAAGRRGDRGRLGHGGAVLRSHTVRVERWRY
eukprot:gene7518-22428_t